MSTKTHNEEYRTKIASHGVVHSTHDAYGHNRDINETMLPYGMSAPLLANSALCELKFH